MKKNAMDMNIPESMQHELDALKTLNPKAPIEMLLLQLETKISHFLCSTGYRLVNYGSNPIPPNIYAMIFFRSGGGKNKPLKEIDKLLFDKWWTEYESKYVYWREDQIKKAKKDAQKQFDNKAMAKASEYIEMNTPRYIQRYISDGTLEGLTAERETFKAFSSGSTFFINTEFSDFILSNNKSREDILTLLKEVFDIGDSEVKSIKGNKTAQRVHGVPSVALVASTPTDFVDGFGREKLTKALKGGFLRRSFIVFPDQVTDYDIQAEEDATEILENMEDFAESFNGKAIDLYDKENKDITLSNEVKDIIHEYKVKSYKRSLLIDNEITSSDLDNSNWKILKLATLFTAWDGKNVVTGKYWGMALDQYSLCANHINKLLTTGSNDLEKLANKMIKKGTLRSMELLKMSGVNKNRFAKWKSENITILTDVLEGKGYKLEVIEEWNGKRVTYKVTKINEIEAKHNLIPSDDLISNLVIQEDGKNSSDAGSDEW